METPVITADCCGAVQFTEPEKKCKKINNNNLNLLPASLVWKKRINTSREGKIKKSRQVDGRMDG